MKKAAIITLVALVALVTSSYKSETLKIQDGTDEALTWHTSLDKANEVSKKENKPIFGFFTGSDWCGWCHKLQREVFAKDKFVKWANDKVVLLELDFPKKKKLPADLAKQNRELQQAFQVKGYPTCWIFYADKDKETDHYNLTALGQLGYPRGAVQGKEEDKFIETADKFLAADVKKSKKANP